VDFAEKLKEIRPDFVPADAYFRPEFVAQEKKMLWPHTWLMACREEHVAKPGDYYVFDVADESIIVIRSSDNIVRAFYNVCRHRARKLKEGIGQTGDAITCRFHGWSWDSKGKCKFVLNREDWDDTGGLGELSLPEVRVDSWAGWIFITMDPDIEALHDYLDPLPDVFRNFDYENTRLAWHNTLVVDCNWKVVLEAFLESYHVMATHPQTLKFGVRKPYSAGYGKHSLFAYPFNRPSEPEPGAPPVDYRKARYIYIEEMNRTLGALWGKHGLKAADRLLEELPADASFDEVNAAYVRFHKEAMAEDGATYPSQITPEDIVRAGTAWNVFPNMIVLPTVDGWQGYRARPNGDNPDSAIFEVWWLERCAPDAPSTIEPKFFPTMESFKGQNYFLEQDFDNIRAVQQGIKSSSFKGARINPEQEATLFTFERTYYQHLVTPRGEVDKQE
jgi:phenylpropionate dioxygenase-like ring-hydroxylating dioxygenase large terminal subunit